MVRWKQPCLSLEQWLKSFAATYLLSSGIGANQTAIRMSPQLGGTCTLQVYQHSILHRANLISGHEQQAMSLSMKTSERTTNLLACCWTDCSAGDCICRADQTRSGSTAFTHISHVAHMFEHQSSHEETAPWYGYILAHSSEASLNREVRMSK